MMSADFRLTHEALFDELERQDAFSAGTAIDVVKLTQAVLNAKAVIELPAPPPPSRPHAACGTGPYQRCESCE